MRKYHILSNSSNYLYFHRVTYHFGKANSCKCVEVIVEDSYNDIDDNPIKSNIIEFSPIIFDN